ncbi:DNA repair protein RecO [Alkalimarinus sediminis]|uniref:DNA repair protein RecO n=1 Tax=Alkalimarinus sediminis TaxID=1632866 RepID=A0A9E8HFY7_9ALTE|nr:DNA repair protein RecO [Alkalimarinus sediminis]UZW73502.1 DNA repair protein RecO [Alkalimarinus sediminis]
MATPVSREPAYLLHSRPYRETSLLIDVFSLNFGVLRLVVKGAQRPSSPLKGILQPFQPLLLSWSGRTDLKNLTDAELGSRLPPLRGDYLYSGLYLNEILTKLLQTYQPAPKLFSAYADVMGSMANKALLEPVLRLFEFRVLKELGAFPSFTEEADAERSIEPYASYYWLPEKGFIRIDDIANPPLSYQRFDCNIGGGARQYIISGAQLIELSQSDLSQKETLLAAKRLSRLMIDHLLAGKPLKSRELIAKARELKKHGTNRR